MQENVKKKQIITQQSSARTESFYESFGKIVVSTRLPRAFEDTANVKRARFLASRSKRDNAKQQARRENSAVKYLRLTDDEPRK